MATDFEFAVVVTRETLRIAESVLEEAHRLVQKIEDELSEFRESSEVYRFNKAFPGDWLPLGHFFGEILGLSRVYLEKSQGRFSPFSRTGWKATFSDLEVDRLNRKIKKNREGLQLGFGAVGKGYALDQVAGLLDREGFRDYRLGSGGSSWVFRGFGADSEPWEIAWAWTRDRDGDWCGHRYRLPGGAPIAVGVSGVVEKGQHFFLEGKPFSVSLQSAFCAGKSAAEADAYSTALIVGASHEGDSYLTKLSLDRVSELSLAYVDLGEQMFYNQAYENLFLREGRKENE